MALFGGLVGLIGITALMKRNEDEDISTDIGEEEEISEEEISENRRRLDELRKRLNTPRKKEKENPQKTVGKIDYTLKSKAEIAKLSTPEKIIYALTLAIDKYKTSAAHCWDWVDKVYQSVGCGRQVIYKNVNYEGHDCGDIHASDALVNQITPGDHIFYNNKNKSDKHGNHSVIFIRWLDKANKIAEVASYNARNDNQHIHKANLNKKPVTYIAKPASKGPINLAILDHSKKRQVGMEIA